MNKEFENIWSRIFKRNPNIVYRMVAKEAVLVPIAQTFDETSSIYSLNETAAKIWELLDGKRPLSRVKEIFSEEFEVTQEQLSNDIIMLVRELQELKMIK